MVLAKTSRTRTHPRHHPPCGLAATLVQQRCSTRGFAMAKSRKLVVVGALLAGLALTTVVPATAQSSTTPKATEIGVSASQIHIAAIADVDNPFAPGLFKGAVDGVKAAAAYLNSKAGGGGLAGRKVVVDFYDSKLNPNETRNATING